MYLDEYDNKHWSYFFDNLQKDASDFFTNEIPYSKSDQVCNIDIIKKKELPVNGKSFDQILADIRTNIIPGSIHQHHKNYIAFPDKGSLATVQYATLLSSLINQNLIAEDKSAPTGTYIEMLVISWLRQLIDYKQDSKFPQNSLELGGAFVSGGVMANTIGLLGARQHAFPEIKTKGMTGITATPKIFVAGSTMSHYSHFGSAWWLGFGTDNIIEVACTDKGNMDQKDLEDKIITCKKNGSRPVAVIALAGDSRTNTIDDLPGLYKITQKHDVWLHADACHGGILAFDQTFTHGDKHYLSYTDSIAFDPHKHMGIPYACSVVLFKESQALAAIGSSTDITIAYGSNDIGQITPFLGSRSFDALKVYVAIQQLGLKGMKEFIDQRKALTKKWHYLLTQSKVFIPMHEPELFALAFSVRPGTMSSQQVTDLNKKLHDTLHDDGKVVIHSFSMRDYRNVLRYGKGTKITALGSSIGSDIYTENDLVQILAFLEQSAIEL